MTDAEWSLIKPLIPPEKRSDRHREVNIREVVNGIFYRFCQISGQLA
jgi:transposase